MSQQLPLMQLPPPPQSTDQHAEALRRAQQAGRERAEVGPQEVLGTANLLLCPACTHMTLLSSQDFTYVNLV